MLRIKKTMLIAAAVLLSSPWVEAKRTPLPEPNPERGAIAVKMRGRFPAGNKAPAVQVYFVRLREEADRYGAEAVIPSNFSRDKQVYLLNARPGRYIAVAAQLRGSGPGEYYVFPDMAAIGQTDVDVVPGRMSFMGDFLFDLKVKMNKSDAAQGHYLRLIRPGAARKGLMGRAFSADYTYRAELVSVDREPDVEKEFWSEALDSVFDKELAWRMEVEKELAELQLGP